MKKIFFLFAFLWSLISFGQALDSIRNSVQDIVPPLNTDRPGQTYNALTVGKGVAMTQLGLSLGGHRLARWDIESSSVQGDVELRYGLTKRLEIGGIYSGLSNQIALDSISDSERSVNSGGGNLRLNILDKSKGALGVRLDYLYKEELSQSYSNVTFRVLGSYSLSDRFGLSSNVSYDYGGSDAVGSFLYTLNLGFNLFDDFGLYLETYGSVSEGAGEYWIDGGFWYLIGPDVQWDLQFAKGFNNNVQDIYVNTGLTWRILDPR